jgi:hypothetical protein
MFRSSMRATAGSMFSSRWVLSFVPSGWKSTRPAGLMAVLLCGVGRFQGLIAGNRVIGRLLGGSWVESKENR